MAKIINITDVVMGTLYIHPLQDGVMNVERNYTLVGDDQALLNAAGTFVMTRSIVWADVPQNLKDALIEFDTWTTAQAKVDRGI